MVRTALAFALIIAGAAMARSEGLLGQFEPPPGRDVRGDDPRFKTEHDLRLEAIIDAYSKGDRQEALRLYEDAKQRLGWAPPQPASRGGSYAPATPGARSLFKELPGEPE